MMESQFKRAQVIMLPTEQKPVKGTLLFRNAFGDKSLWQYKETYTYKCGTEVYRTLGGSFEDWSVGMRPHHIYGIIKEEIKFGDWFIWKNNNAICQATVDLDIIDAHLENGDIKKIIFTTDKELTVQKCDASSLFHPKTKIGSLPQPSEKFLQRYVEAYRDKKIVTGVLVEYETIMTGQCNCICHKPGNVVMHVAACCHPEYKETIKIDSKNNTVTTKKLKTLWNREEVLFLISKYHIAICVDKTHINPGDITKWFEENL